MSTRTSRIATLTAATMLAMTAGVSTMTGAQAATAPTTLNIGQSLVDGQELLSRNGQHHLYVGDVATAEGLTIGGNSCWASFLKTFDTGTLLPPTSNKLVMQSDGNLVLYSYGPGYNGKATWASGTVGKGGHHVSIRDDMQLTIHNARGAVIWSSKSTCTTLNNYDEFIGDLNNRYLRSGWFMQSPNRYYKLVMQGDGNLVLYTPSRAIWSSKTSGNPGAALKYRDDGRMVLYSTSGKVLWASKATTQTSNPRTEYLTQLQNDGNFAQYKVSNSGTRTLYWSTGTKGVR